MLINDTTYAYNLRGAIIRELIKDNYEVVVVGQILKHKDKLENIGVRLVNIDVERHSTNPLSDLMLLNKYVNILKLEKPNVVLTYNIKPNVYGGIACKKLDIPYISNVTGLGTPVENPGPLQLITTKLYKLGVSDAKFVFFQNKENQLFFKKHGMISKSSKTNLLPGSGVDLHEHPILEYPDQDLVNFQFTSRILKEKGIDLYLNAAKIIQKKYRNTAFHVCGGCDDQKYLKILEEAQNEGYIIYHGQQKDMTPFLKQASCVVHPSYYPEGMSNVLLEGAASARPIIATNRSGCKETVDDGVTGFLIPIKDESSLIAAIEKFLHLTNNQRKEMGLAGRRKMENEFDRQIVVNAYMDAIKEIEGV